MAFALTYLYLVAVMVNLVGATLLAVASPPQLAKRSMVITVSLVAAWALSDFLCNMATAPEQIHVIARVFAPSWALVPFFIVRIALAYAAHLRPLRSLPINALLLLPAALCCYLVLSGRLYSAYLPAEEARPFFTNRATWWQLVLDIYFLGYNAAAGVLLWRARQRTTLQEYDTSARLVIGMLPATLLGGLVAGSLAPLGIELPFLASIVITVVTVYTVVGVLRRAYFPPIAQRDRAQENLSRREEVLEGIPVGVAILSPGGEILFANCRFTALVAAAVGEPLPPVIAGELQGSPRERKEVTLPGGDNGEQVLAVEAVTVSYAGAAAQLVTLADITHQRALEHQLRESQKMEAIGTLAGGVAHDINNILCTIMGFASLIRSDEQGGGPWGDDIERILEASKRGRSLTRDLLGFARRGQHLQQEVDLNATASEVAELLRRTLSRKIEVELRLTPALSSVLGDPTQLHHALLNVGLNAADAMPAGGTLLICTGEGDDAPAGRSVRVELRDTGCGMDASVRERCLEPLFTTKPRGQGTGLGLSMVYGTVSQHQGALVIDSAPGEGTTVTLSFPAAGPSAADASAEVAASVQPGQGTILLVDDEEMIRAMGRRLLERLSYTVFEAEDGRAALELFQRRREEIDLVILDLVMPVMDGEETFSALRELDSELPVLLVSGFGRQGAAAELISRGARGFVQKPFDLGQLSEGVTRAMGGSAAQK
jgi:signal transduction histidine kinase/CheY-like chemotaxis protein